MPTAAPESSRGKDATIAMSREDLNATQNAEDTTRSKDRMASARANRTQAQKNEDTDLNTEVVVSCYNTVAPTGSMLLFIAISHIVFRTKFSLTATTMSH
jgi:phage I-like protein